MVPADPRAVEALEAIPVAQSSHFQEHIYSSHVFLLYKIFSASFQKLIVLGWFINCLIMKSIHTLIAFGALVSSALAALPLVESVSILVSIELETG